MGRDAARALVLGAALANGAASIVVSSQVTRLLEDQLAPLNRELKAKGLSELSVREAEHTGGACE